MMSLVSKCFQISVFAIALAVSPQLDASHRASISLEGKLQEYMTIRVRSVESSLPLVGLNIELGNGVSPGVFTTNANGTVNAPVVRGLSYTVAVNGIRIRNGDTDLFMIPAQGEIRSIEVELSKADLARADETARRNRQINDDLTKLRQRVDRCDVFRTVRGFLDTVFADQISVGDTILFTDIRTGKTLMDVSDGDGWLYYDGYKHGVSPGDTVVIARTEYSLARSGSQVSWSAQKFVFSGRALEPSWQGDFPYVLIPISSNRLMGLDYKHGFKSVKMTELLDRELSFLAQQLKRQNVNVELQGHTDNQAVAPSLAESVKANIDLSYRRAEEIRQLLFSKYGVPLERMKAVGYGQEFPIADNSTESGREANNRITFKLRRR